MAAKKRGRRRHQMKKYGISSEISIAMKSGGGGGNHQSSERK